MEIVRQTAVASYVVVPLIDAAARPSYKASPTLAAGDVKVIRHTGAAWNIANIGTLPTIVDAGVTKQILVTLTATELTSDNLDYPVIVQFIDQTAPKEWDDQEIIIWTKAVPANTTQILGTAVSPPATAGILDVNLKNIANAAVSTSTAQLGVNAVQAGATAWGSGAITAAAIATGAIDADAIADNAIDAGAIATGAITNAKFASGAIDAAAIAADAIGASEFAQGAADKVWSSAARTLTAFSTSLAVSVWDVLTANIATANSIGKKFIDWLAGTDTSTPTVNVTKVNGTSQTAGDIIGDTNDIQTRIPAALVSGRMDSSVGAMAASVVTASAIATDAIGSDEISAAAVTKIQNGLATPTNITAGTITTVTNLTNAPTNGDLTATMKASVNAEVDTAITDVKLDHLIAVAESGDVVNSSIIAKLASKSVTPAFSSYNNTTDSLEAIADNESPAEVTANVTKIDGVALSTHSAGMMPSDMKAIDNNATSGNNATLNLKKLDITNVDGLAVNILGYGNDTNGVQISGGLGVYNAHGDAINVLSAGTGGEEGQVGRGVSIQSYQSDAIHAQAGVNGNGFSTIGEGTGSGILANSGTSNGSNNAGIHAVGNATNSHGISLVSGANGNDLNLETPSTNLEAVVDQQAVRDAMTLSTTEEFAAGSIDDVLETIDDQTSKMNFTGDNIDANTEAIDTNAGAAAKLAASADTETLCTVDTSRPFAPTTTEFETGSTVLAKDRWVIFRSGTLIGQAKPITACEPISGKSHITTEAFTAAPSNGDTFVIV